jgi:glucose-1-phosphate adenylyltransferase
MATPRIAAFVMAGGEGTRLRPLTEQMPKPALPFAGRCRIIDFALANLQQSGAAPIFVLLQYKPQVLLDHLQRHWPAAVPLLPAQAYRGTADAVRQNLGRLEGLGVDLVAVFAADHVYRMDVRQMAAFHVARGADVTIAALRVPIGYACEFGVLVTDADGRVVGFQEKPAHPAPLPGDPGSALVSMGNYLFAPAVLKRTLREAALCGEHDFGCHVLPRLVREGRVYAYDFRLNTVPGTRPTEESGYWRDVGTVGAYRDAEADARGPRPRFALDNPEWPVAPTLAPERPECGGAERRQGAWA